MKILDKLFFTSEVRIFFVIQCCLVYLIHKVSITTFLLFSQYLVMLYREQPTICIINLICIESKNEREKIYVQNTLTN